MSLREEAAEYGDVLGIDLVLFGGDAYSDSSHATLCLDDAERRGVTDGDDFSFIHEGDGRIPSPCDDCGRLIG